MRELMHLGQSHVEWRSVPRLGGPGEALVLAVIAARCDGDNLPLFAIGHECIAVVVECGEPVWQVRKGQLAIGSEISGTQH